MMEVMTGVSSRVMASPSTPPTERVKPSRANSLTNCSMVLSSDGGKGLSSLCR